MGAAVALSLVVPGTARAHKGPPFPIIVDRQLGPYVVSVWTDPDIGIGTFFVVLQAPNGARLPPVTRVRISVRPISGRLAEVQYDATPQRVRRGARYLARVEFDRGEWWEVRIVIEGPDGGGELEARVQATPAGDIGPIGLVIYALPFVAVGALWLRAVLARRSARSLTQSTSTGGGHG
jgi:hypothetical protein